jgi:hypothetical protein
MADTTPLVLGANLDDATATPKWKLAGLLDEVLPFDRALTGADVMRLAGGAAP